MNSVENKGTRMTSVKKEHFIKLELKYCERCGGLWIRRRGEMETRCQRCVAEEGQLTQLWRARSHPEYQANVAQAAVPSPAELSMGAIQP